MANDPTKLIDVNALDRFKTKIETEIPEPIQYSTMPTASADLVGSIVQFTGTTDNAYTNGYFYKCVNNSGTYSWSAISVQAGGGSSAVTSVAGKTGAVVLDSSDVGLGNVGNFKAVSTVADQGLTTAEKTNARDNIGAGTSNLEIGTTAYDAAAGNHTHSAATTSAAGFMSAADKTKLENLSYIQYDVMPTPTVADIDTVVQYVGRYDSNYTFGQFYYCTDGETSGTYIWAPLNVQHVCEVKTMPEASKATAGKVYHYVGPSTEYYDQGTWYKATPNAPYMMYKITENYTSTEKTKLSGIATGATANTVTDTTVTISAANWSGSSAPYTATKSVTGMLSTDTPIIDIVVSSTTSTGLDQLEQYSYISRAETSNGSITFYCYEDKPTISLTISIKIIR